PVQRQHQPTLGVPSRVRPQPRPRNPIQLSSVDTLQHPTNRALTRIPDTTPKITPRPTQLPQQRRRHIRGLVTNLPKIRRTRQRRAPPHPQNERQRINPPPRAPSVRDILQHLQQARNITLLVLLLSRSRQRREPLTH